MQNIDSIDGHLVMDSRLHKHLPAIYAMAHDRTESGRLALAEKLAQVFLMHAAALTSNEEELVNGLISDLLKNESASVRHALISHFAEAIDAPRNVAMRIVNGPVEIAHPILVGNPHLSDDDLITVVQSKGGDHAMAVAEREQISEAVADALVTTGDLRIMHIVANNMGAKLSAKAIDVMVDAARLAAILHKPILDRPEINAESAARLYWWVAQDLRRVTLDRFGFGPGKLDMALKKAVDDKIQDSMLVKDNTEAMQTLADWLEERGALSVKILPQLLRAGHYRLFNVLLSRLAKISLTLVDVMTNASGGKLLVVLCRAIEIDKGNFVSIFLMSRGGREGEQIVHPRELTQALTAYDRLDVGKANAMLQTWRLNPDDLLLRAQETLQTEA